MDDHRTKLAWAREHLRTLHAAIDAFINDEAYEARVERRTNAHDYIVRFYVKKEIPAEWSLIVGDIIHNARSALDNLTYALVLAHHGTPTDKEVVNIQFLLADGQKDFADRAIKNLGLMSPDAQAAMQRLQPCYRQDKSVRHWLSVLRDLSNVDKHRHLILTYATAVKSSVDIKINGKPFGTVLGEDIGTLKNGAILAAGEIVGGLPLDAEVEMRANVSVQISFPNTWPAWGGNVFYTLKTTCDFIEDNIFRWLEPLL
jgi:hypothetical protein